MQLLRQAVEDSVKSPINDGMIIDTPVAVFQNCSRRR